MLIHGLGWVFMWSKQALSTKSPDWLRANPVGTGPFKLVSNCINDRYMIGWGQGGNDYGQKTTCSRMFGKRQKDIGNVGA